MFRASWCAPGISGSNSRRGSNRRIVVVREEWPMGTAGALRKAIEQLDGDTVLVLNGDSYVDTSLGRFPGMARGARLAVVTDCDADRECGGSGNNRRRCSGADRGVSTWRQKHGAGMDQRRSVAARAILAGGFAFGYSAVARKRCLSILAQSRNGRLLRGRAFHRYWHTGSDGESAGVLRLDQEASAWERCCGFDWSCRANSQAGSHSRAAAIFSRRASVGSRNPFTILLSAVSSIPSLLASWFWRRPVFHNCNFRLRYIGAPLDWQCPAGWVPRRLHQPPSIQLATAARWRRPDGSDS